MLISRISRINFKNSVTNLLMNRNEIETWALHPLTDYYLISNLGNIKSLRTNKILKSSKNRQGYHLINIDFNDGHRQAVMVHRMVIETFLNHFSNEENIYEVNHITGNKSDNRLLNLEWMTRKENLQHARDNKLFKSMKGELNSNCKFSNKDIELMRQLYKNGYKIIEISRKFKSHRSYISGIVHGRKRNV